jgi:hypothetical protein
MAEHHKELGEDAARIANWLVDNREQFEQSGITEDSIGGLAGVTGPDAVQTAIDQLENKEVVVRDPEALTPPRFTIKPGRSWPETRDALLNARSAAG